MVVSAIPEKGVLAFHGGHALAELGSWLLAADGEDSLGPWSIVVIFAGSLRPTVETDTTCVPQVSAVCHLI